MTRKEFVNILLTLGTDESPVRVLVDSYGLMQPWPYVSGDPGNSIYCYEKSPGTIIIDAK